MLESARPFPERDEDGFLDLTALRLARIQDAARFDEALQSPALLVAGSSEAPRRETPPNMRRELSYRRTTISATPRGPASRELASYAGRLAFVDKRPGNPFPSMIAIGRAMNNDIVFLLETVSKFHGFFSPAADGWTFTDQRSANGTLVNGRRIEGGKAHPIADGDKIRFGLDLEARFFLPGTLLARLA
jgi:hypothetical protein